MPTNDAKMIYDYDNHRYVLNYQGNGEHVNLAQAYGSIENIRTQLNSISRSVYNYIYSQGHTGNRNYVEYLLASEKSLRDVIYNAMLSQLIADIESGVDSVKNQVGLNLETGGAIDRKLLFRHMISPEAELTLLASDGKTNLLYTGDRGFRLDEDRYTKLGY